MTYKLLFFISIFTLTSHLKAQFIFSNDIINSIELHTNDSSIKANVYLFLSPECPLCRSYTSTINELYSCYQTKGFNFFGVISGTQFSKHSIEEFKNRYHLKPTFILDSTKKITNQLQATITPEVFVVGTNGYTLYSGRIDDWAYALGKKRKHITDHNLLNALEDILNARIIKNPKTTAIGCYIE
jgi:thiol-disulfide isomerase/thioredoxin